MPVELTLGVGVGRGVRVPDCVLDTLEEAERERVTEGEAESEPESVTERAVDADTRAEREKEVVTEGEGEGEGDSEAVLFCVLECTREPVAPLLGVPRRGEDDTEADAVLDAVPLPPPRRGGDAVTEAVPVSVTLPVVLYVRVTVGDGVAVCEALDVKLLEADVLRLSRMERVSELEADTERVPPAARAAVPLTLALAVALRLGGCDREPELQPVGVLLCDDEGDSEGVEVPEREGEGEPVEEREGPAGEGVGEAEPVEEALPAAPRAPADDGDAEPEGDAEPAAEALPQGLGERERLGEPDWLPLGVTDRLPLADTEAVEDSEPETVPETEPEAAPLRLAAALALAQPLPEALQLPRALALLEAEALGEGE